MSWIRYDLCHNQAKKGLNRSNWIRTKEIVVDKTLGGKKLSNKLIPVAACNPYRIKDRSRNYDYESEGLNVIE